MWYINGTNKTVEEVLKSAVEKKFGFKILNRGDCEKLSEVIQEQTSKSVSYNTLRRMYGFAKPVKTRKDTLNILSNYVGYRSYYHFVNATSHQISWESRLRLYELKGNKNTKALLSFLEQKSQTDEDITLPIINLIREFLLAKRMDELNVLFTSNVLKNNINTYQQKLIIGNATGTLLRNLKFSNREFKELCNTEFFQTTIFEIFVDYSSLNGFYAVLLKYFSEKKDYKNKVFVSCLLNLRNFLNNKKIKNLKIDDTTLITLHPILVGRYFSNFLLTEKKQAYFFEIKKIANASQMVSPLHQIYYEPMVIGMLTNNLKVLSWISEQIETHLSQKAYPEPHYMETFHLMKTFYLIQIGATENATSMFEKVNTDNFILSYKTFLLFFYHAMGYKVYQSQKFQQRFKESLEKNPYQYLSQFYFKHM